MLNLAARFIRSFTPAPTPEPRRWAVPPGQRVYAIGDIHGRLDLLRALTSQLRNDDAERGAAETTFVVLGDLVNRGRDSAGVIDFLIDLEASGGNSLLLAGNHDEVFLRAACGDRDMASRLHKMGGRETALSYGIASEEYDSGGFDDLAALLHARVPTAHVAFLRRLREWGQIGDYVFVHAGIRPGTPLRDQTVGDLRWIRGEFLEAETCHGAMIVHGHTITPDPDLRHNRIGIDTGAFRTGRLTAIGLEGTERWFLTT
jgi:serine/threonine protein phosphatase 1